MPRYYLLLKALHILGVIWFLGNIIVSGFWKAYADRTRNWSIIRFSQRLITYTDIIFTTIGVIIILLTGFAMAQFYGDFMKVKWISWGIYLFAVSGVIWLFILVPIQIILHRLVNKYPDQHAIPRNYWFYENIWMLFGVIATLLPLINIYWMVFKPH